MPPTVHEHALLPVGQLSEEAQEARNKDFKKYRKQFTRKISRICTNQDIFNMLLVSSVISSKCKLHKRKLNQFPKEALELLLTSTVHSVVNETNQFKIFFE